MFSFAFLSLGQEAVIPRDSINMQVNTKGFFKYDEFNKPIPSKSIKYSLILPGMGQLYNRRWWKLPLVYGAIGGLYYAIDYNQDLYRRFRDALELELLGEAHEFTDNGLSSTSLRTFRDTYDRYTQLSYMGTILLYGVIAIESFVDGHLINFDISDDLSMQVDPRIISDPISNRNTIGLGVVISIN